MELSARSESSSGDRILVMVAEALPVLAIFTVCVRLYSARNYQK